MVKKIFFLLVAFFLLGHSRGFGDEKAMPVLTHADAAVMLAKYSGFFDRYVPEEADLNECVAFLNKTGIYFGLLEVVNGTEFTLEDCARTMGQIELVLRGEAVFSGGKVGLPPMLDSWKEYCIMNGVKFTEAYQAMLGMLRVAYGQGR
jgi:hypothetical protein